MSGDDLLYQVEQGVAYFTINREPQRNAISADVIRLFFKYLDKAEKEDAGRGLEFFWLNGEFGVEHLGLQTFSSDKLIDVDAVDTT